MIQIVFQSSLHFHKKKLLFLRKISTSSKEIRSKKKKKKKSNYQNKEIKNFLPIILSSSSFQIPSNRRIHGKITKTIVTNCSKVSFDLQLEIERIVLRQRRSKTVYTDDSWPYNIVQERRHWPAYMTTQWKRDLYQALAEVASLHYAVSVPLEFPTRSSLLIDRRSPFHACARPFQEQRNKWIRFRFLFIREKWMQFFAIFSLFWDLCFDVARFSKNVEQEERIQVYRLLPFWRTKCVEMNYELVNE